MFGLILNLPPTRSNPSLSTNGFSLKIELDLFNFALLPFAFNVHPGIDLGRLH